MKQARLGVLASLGIGVFVSHAQGGNGWEIKRQPWGDSPKNDWEIKRQPWGSSTSQQWSESGQWTEQWKWTADQQQLPAAPGSAWQFSQSNTITPPLPPGASSQGKWTWVPAPSSGGFYWSYTSSSSSLPSSSSQGLGAAPGTAWQFSQSNTTPPPLPAGQSVGRWTWVSGPSPPGGYYWSFIPGPKQDLPAAPGTAWQFSQSNTVAPPLPAGATSGSWKWISAPSGGGYYWSFIARPMQSLPPPPGSQWIFSTSSIVAPPFPAGASGSGTWKWVSSPDGKGYYWSYISSGGQKSPQQKLPEPPTGGSGWIFSTSSTTPPALPAGASSSGSWKWVSSPDGKGYYWSWISTPGAQLPAQKLPEPPTGGTTWIFSASSIVPPALPAGISGTGSWKWVSNPSGTGYYWSFISSPPSPQQQLPRPSSGSTEWIFSVSKTTPPSLPPGISSTAGTWKWISSPTGSGYYWSFTPSYPSIQQLPAPKPGATGWIFSESRTEPPKISGITASGSWTWISSSSGAGYYWTWSPGAPQGIPPGFQGGVVTPGSGTEGSYDKKPSPEGGNNPTQPGYSTGGLPVYPGQPGQQGGVPVNPGQQGEYPQVQPGQQGGVPVNPGQQGEYPQVQPGQQGGIPVHPGQQGGVPEYPGEEYPQLQPGQQGGVPVYPGQQGGIPDHPSQGGVPVNPQQPSTGGFDHMKPGTGGYGYTKPAFEESFDHTGKPISGGDVPSGQPGSEGPGDVPFHGGVRPQLPQGGSQPQPGDQGQAPTEGPFGGSFDHTGKPIDTTDGQSTGGVPVHPSTGDQPPINPGDQGQVPIEGPFGGSFDHTGKPTEGGGLPSGSHSSGGVPVQQPGTTGETSGNPHPGGEGSVPSTGTEDDIVKGPFGGIFDKQGNLIETGSQGTYKCPPRSRIELFDAPTVPEAICPNSQDRRYSAGGGKDFYILCCRHVDGGKKEIAVIPSIPSLQYCIHICAGTANCKSVLYTARQGYNSNYPVKSCQLFEHGNYEIQTTCNNDAHDSAYLIEPPTGTTGDLPSPSLTVEPPTYPPHQVDVPPSFIMLPPGISEQCVQNVLAAIKCGTCASC